MAATSICDGWKNKLEAIRGIICGFLYDQGNKMERLRSIFLWEEEKDIQY
jgi:hypothetical protein